MCPDGTALSRSDQECAVGARGGGSCGLCLRLRRGSSVRRWGWTTEGGAHAVGERGWRMLMLLSLPFRATSRRRTSRLARDRAPSGPDPLAGQLRSRSIAGLLGSGSPLVSDRFRERPFLRECGAEGHWRVGQSTQAKGPHVVALTRANPSYPPTDEVPPVARGTALRARSVTLTTRMSYWRP